ncbi:hypothetical protein GCM10023341_08510 [Ornithinimicrobium tianjinense]
MRASFPIGGVKVRVGQRREVKLDVSRLVTGAEVTLPVHVVHGREDGPVVWLDAAIHGDEVVGIEVIRRALARLSPRTLRGTVLAVPIVNVLGVMTGDRYLPDRRDLNRSFPGSPRGSLASRIAHLLMTEVVAKCEVGIDLHTGSDRRSNLPQVRCDLDDERTRTLAEAFGAPVIYHAKLRDGSLRSAAREAGARVLLYEAGEAWRLDEYAVGPGVDGVLRVLGALGMITQEELDASLTSRPVGPSVVCRRSAWVRARRTGMLHMEAVLGQQVTLGQRLGTLYDSYGRRLAIVKADRDGVVIGRTEAPLVNSGDAVVHIAEIEPVPEPDPIVVAGVVLRDEAGRLLTVRKHGTSRFMLPGGKLEPGENAVEAGVREVWEEVGLRLDASDVYVLGEYDGRAANEPGARLLSTVLVAPLTGEPQPTGEIAELRWLTPEEMARVSAVDADDLAPLLTDHVLPALGH